MLFTRNLKENLFTLIFHEIRISLIKKVDKVYPPFYTQI